MNMAKLWALALILSSAFLFAILVMNQTPDVIRPRKIAKPADGPVPPPPPVENQSATANQPPALNEENLPRVTKAPKVLAAEINDLCKHLVDELEASHITPAFSNVNLKFHEKRLIKPEIKAMLGSCFQQKKDSKNRAEMDIFSSDFAGEKAADLVQVQVSIFDRQSKNKIFESGIHFELSSVDRSGSTAQPVVSDEAEVSTDERLPLTAAATGKKTTWQKIDDSSTTGKVAPDDDDEDDGADLDPRDVRNAEEKEDSL